MMLERAGKHNGGIRTREPQRVNQLVYRARGSRADEYDRIILGCVNRIADDITRFVPGMEDKTDWILE